MVEQVSEMARELNQAVEDVSQEDAYGLGGLLSEHFLAKVENADLLEELYDLIKGETFDDAADEGSSSLP